MTNMKSNLGTCMITFPNKSEKEKAFYELIHSKTHFSGVDKNTIIIQEKDCQFLESKHIKYERIP